MVVATVLISVLPFLSRPGPSWGASPPPASSTENLCPEPLEQEAFRDANQTFSRASDRSEQSSATRGLTLFPLSYVLSPVTVEAFLESLRNFFYSQVLTSLLL